MEKTYTLPLHRRQCCAAEEFIFMMAYFGLRSWATDEDHYEFRVKDLTYHLGTGEITRDGCPTERERGINALLALLGHSSDELPPDDMFNPEFWPGGTFGPPSLG